jgi:ABC-type nitrate/sulfonate/bicarbonate transport system substrate-binding protein
MHSLTPRTLSPRTFSPRALIGAALALTLTSIGLLGCGSGDSPTTASGSSAGSGPTSGIAPVRDAEPFPAERCAANEAAGKITFLTGFDYAAAASIVEVIYAADLGYYRDLCLDVEILSSFSTANYPLVAGGQGQFASGGSFSEVVAFAAANEADLVAVMVAGSTPIDTLILKSDVATAGASVTAQDLAGATIGVKGKLPASIEVMLLRAGLRNGVDFTTVPVDGFDPTAHIAIPSIVGFPGWKSNEPGRLERENISFVTLDPTEAQVPGSFGAIFTSRSFMTAHPTAVEDFVRATLKGLAAAIANPAAAAEAAVALVIANGNPNFLSPEGEVFRWATEAELILSRTPAATAPGTPNPDLLSVEVETYAEVGFFGPGTAPDLLRHVDATIAIGVTTPNGTVIWPEIS